MTAPAERLIHSVPLTHARVLEMLIQKFKDAGCYCEQTNQSVGTAYTAGGGVTSSGDMASGGAVTNIERKSWNPFLVKLSLGNWLEAKVTLVEAAKSSVPKGGGMAECSDFLVRTETDASSQFSIGGCLVTILITLAFILLGCSDWLFFNAGVMPGGLVCLVMLIVPYWIVKGITQGKAKRNAQETQALAGKLEEVLTAFEVDLKAAS